jgi:hypothetical protein
MQDIIQCILKPTTVPDTITKLAATTFAQPVESKMLSVMVPLLVRGLRERNTAIKRQTAVIISNMVKLVENPAEIAPFMATLLPEVDKIGKEISDPNARAVAVNTHALLVKAAGSEDGRAALEAEQAKRATPDVRGPPFLHPPLRRFFVSFILPGRWAAHFSVLPHFRRISCLKRISHSITGELMCMHGVYAR